MSRHSMIRIWAAVVSIGIAAGCGGRVISPYDVDLDHGIQGFKARLSQLVSEAASKAGTLEGSFESYRKGYSDLELDLALLRDRAAILEAKDVNCSVPDVIKKLVPKSSTGVIITPVAAAPAVVPDNAIVPVSPLAIGRRKNLAAPVGCMTRLIDNIAAQLTSIETIHADPQQCVARDQPTLTCLRPAAAAGALGFANDSLDAAQIVEVYKNEGGS